jgi:hypothetical protein
MAAREVSFDEQRNVARRFLAALLEDAEDWASAASVRALVTHRQMRCTLRVCTTHNSATRKHAAVLFGARRQGTCPLRGGRARARALRRHAM